MRPLFLTIIISGSLFVKDVQAISVTLKSVADTTLFETTPDNNLGNTSLASGTTVNGLNARALVKFNLGATIPSNAVITNVTVTFTVVKAPHNNASASLSTFNLYRMQVSWIEGTKGSMAAKSGTQGTPASAGEPTWNSRADGSILWDSPGGNPGTDFDATPSAANLLTSSRLAFTSSSGLISDVQLWLTNASANFGWLLRSEAEGNPATARRFGSKESTSSQQPTLVIGYTVPVTATPPVIGVQPQSQTGYGGETVRLSVSATGDGTLAYQWTHNGVDLTTGTLASLSLPKFQAADAGDYTVKVSNAGGSVTSRTAILSFVPAPRIEAIALNTNVATISFTAHPRHTFTVEALDDLGKTTWSAAGSLSATNAAIRFSLIAPAATKQRFYRLAVQPLP